MARRKKCLRIVDMVSAARACGQAVCSQAEGAKEFFCTLCWPPRAATATAQRHLATGHCCSATGNGQRATATGNGPPGSAFFGLCIRAVRGPKAPTATGNGNPEPSIAMALGLCRTPSFAGSCLGKKVNILQEMWAYCYKTSRAANLTVLQTG